MIRGFPPDDDHEAAHVEELVRRAARQLKAIPGTPGLIVLDVTAYTYAINQLGYIHELLRTKAWAAHLAGVVVLDQLGVVAEGEDPAHVYDFAYVIPGPLHEALCSTLLPALNWCEQGHLHYDPLLPTPPCCRLPW